MVILWTFIVNLAIMCFHYSILKSVEVEKYRKQSSCKRSGDRMLLKTLRCRKSNSTLTGTSYCCLQFWTGKIKLQNLDWLMKKTSVQRHLVIGRPVEILVHDRLNSVLNYHLPSLLCTKLLLADGYSTNTFKIAWLKLD